MRLSLRKIATILFTTLLSLILLLTALVLGFMLFLKTDKGQTWLTQTTNDFLSKQLETRLQIEKVGISFPNALRLTNTRVYDHKDSILLKSNQIKVGFNLFSFKNNNLIFSHLTLDQPTFYGRQYAGDTTFNYNYIINNLQPDEPSKDEGIYRTLFNQVQIKNGLFVHKNLQEPEDTTKGTIHFQRLKVQDLNLDAKYLQFINGRITAEIQNLNFLEESGFKLEKLKSSFTLDDKQFSFDNLELKTPQSLIQEKIRMTYESQEALSNFIEEVTLTTDFKNSHLSLKDLSYFVPGMEKQDKTIRFKGNLEGQVDGFKSKNLRIAIGDNTFLQGNLNFDGLPNIDETFINIECQKASFDQSDIKTFFPELDLPENLKKLGDVSFEGNFTGFVSDFVAYGEFNTDLGKAKTDINLKNPTNETGAEYSGYLKLNRFDIGKLLDNEKLIGKLSMEGNIEGKGVSLETMKAKINASAQRLDLNNYQYQGIKVEGTFAEKLFKGELSIKDPNIGLDFNGVVDFTKAKPLYDFNAEVRNANLYAMNLVQDTLILNTDANLNFSANNLDDIEGNLALKNTKLNLNNKVLDFKKMEVSSTIDNGQKTLELNSDLADVNLNGTYNLTSLASIAKMTIARYVDDRLVSEKDFKRVEESIAFNVHIKNAAFLMELAKTDFVLEDNTKINGSINTKTANLALDGEIPGLYYQNYHLEGISIDGSGSANELFLKVGANSLYDADSQLLKDSEVRILKGKSDTLQFNIALADQNNQNQAKLLGNVLPTKNFVKGKFQNSKIILGDTTWRLNSKSITHYYDSLTEVPRLAFQNGSQSITLDGAVSKQQALPLRIIFQEFQLANITQRLFPQYEAYTGKVNGQVMLYNLYKQPYFNTGLILDPMSVSGEKMGALTINTNYQPETKNINVESALKSKNQETLMDLAGYLNFHKEENLNLRANVEKTDLKLVEGLVSDFISDLKGTFDAGIQVNGSFEKPSIKGYANFNNASLTVNYLNTKYRLDHTVTFDSSKIDFNQMKLIDEKNNVAFVRGAINHEFFNNFRLNLNVQAQNFQALNTKQKHNDIYYGEAYATGQMQFTGPLQNITMNMQLKPEKNTQINLPISQSSEYSAYEFIKFTDKNQPFQQEKKVDFKGINMNMNIEMTPDALIQIIFDPKIGDIMKGRGSGNLRLQISSTGDFNMYGNYTIQNGDYLFTAFDIVNKRFNIKEGSTIKWNGNPYEAQMDIQAAYNVQASPAPLIPESSRGSNSNYNQKLPVEAQLFMAGSLFSPEINLDFEIKGLNNRAGNVNMLNSQIKKIKNDEQALNQQVVSLLVMNRFYPVETNQFQAGQALESGRNSMVGDLISNQLTYWVSQFSENVKYLENLQVGFNYQQQGKVEGDEVSQQELEVALSTSLFNDRVEISGSMDMENTAGNIEVNYKLTEEGKVRVKVFSRNSNSLINENVQTQGTGLIWSKEFDTWKEFFSRDAKNEQPEKDRNQKKEKKKKLEKPDSKGLKEQPIGDPEQN